MSKSTASLLAMTAFDTTNLRLAIVVPAHGMVLFRLRCGAITGATTVPTVLLGVMNGSTVLGRVTPQDFPGTMNAATQSCPCQVEFVVTGLTPGAMNVDAAYGVEVVVASTNIKYGGPNNTTTNDAWGGFVFEAWDPQPQQTNGQLVVDANGRIDVSKVAGTTQTARDLGAQLDAAVSSRMATFTLPTNFSSLVIDANGRVDLSKWLGVAVNALLSGRVDASVGAMAANVLTAAAINAAALNGKGDWNIGKTGYALTSGEEDAIVNKVWDELTAEARAGGSYGLLLQAIAGYIDTEVAAIKAKTDNLPVNPAATGDQMALTGATIDLILDDPIEGALTMRQALRLIIAAVAGKADGFPSGPVHYRDQADGKNRITATVDANGNRSVVTVDGT